MKIPAKFKSGLVTYTVHLVDKIELEFYSGLGSEEALKGKIFKGEGFIFGLCDPVGQNVWIATETLEGKPIPYERQLSTFYHELAHALVGETANNEVNTDEVFIEALGKNLYAYAQNTFEGEAKLYVEEEEEEEVIEEPKKKTKKK